MIKKKKAVKVFDSLVDVMISNLAKQGFSANIRLYLEWKKIIGEELSSFCEFDRLSFPIGKTNLARLYVRTHSSFCLSALEYKKTILERVNTYLGYPAVSHISFLHIPLRQPSSFSQEKELEKHKIATKYKLKSSIENQIEGIKDLNLRKALYCLGELINPNS